ncbi:hypothetical protein CPAR01_12433 [Colletotrichum paranaense]|uniref:Uncharacterized protein n=1 Tax=Colletotrichum paranaense TaxID=1914294 RepID=A0ABQ9S7G0_9PEZI|nr:uncharacterized protein CPAR01_12433 [Colletotrichum paranaense]KAK1527875.1 hypothetical protein CPAR01_12433 [Colletotrichum paranaense]
MTNAPCERLENEVSRSLDLIAKFWLTINFDTFPLSQIYPKPVQLAWEETRTLRQVIESYFSCALADQPNKLRPGAATSIPSTFNITVLCERYNFFIRWTSNLAEQLQVDGESGQRSATCWNHEIAEEREEELWRLGRCGRTRKVELDDFSYWKLGIRKLLEEYSKPPRGTQQLRLDKEGRNFLEFSTFWTALIVAILTILGIAFGTIGTAYAVKAYNLSYKQFVLSQKQYNLDLVQACADPEASQKWTEFCRS